MQKVDNQAKYGYLSWHTPCSVFLRTPLKGITMKIIGCILIAFLLFTGCHTTEVDKTAPPIPQGITTVSLDNEIEIQWLPSQASDLAGYDVWVSAAYDGPYEHIGTTTLCYYRDQGAVNGSTYYYAVSSFDSHNNTSALSIDTVYDTPRPEGLDQSLSDVYTDPGTSGYGFSAYSVLPYTDERTDLYYGTNVSGLHFLSVKSANNIQDMGYSSSLDEISSSPSRGWAPSKSVEAIVGHTYVIWTASNHYAKVRVTQTTISLLVFDWAYQTATGNPELRIANNQPAANRPKQGAERQLMR